MAVAMTSQFNLINDKTPNVYRASVSLNGTGDGSGGTVTFSLAAIAPGLFKASDLVTLTRVNMFHNDSAMYAAAYLTRSHWTALAPGNTVTADRLNLCGLVSTNWYGDGVTIWHTVPIQTCIGNGPLFLGSPRVIDPTGYAQFQTNGNLSIYVVELGFIIYRRPE